MLVFFPVMSWTLMNSLRCLLTKRGRVWASNVTLNTSEMPTPTNNSAHTLTHLCIHGVFVLLQVCECFKDPENSGGNSTKGQVETESRLQNQQARVFHRGRRDGGAEDQQNTSESKTQERFSITHPECIVLKLSPTSS